MHHADQSDWANRITPDALVPAPATTATIRDGFYDCACGNSPESDGFEFLDRTGTPTDDPSPATWSGTYACNRCGAVLDSHTADEAAGTVRIIGRLKAAALRTVYLAWTDNGSNVYVPGARCVDCDTTYDPYYRTGVPCENAVNHARHAVYNWQRLGDYSARVVTVEVPEAPFPQLITTARKAARAAEAARIAARKAARAAH